MSRNIQTMLSIALAGGIVSSQAWGATSTVTFTGNVTATCALNVVNGTGTLTANGSLSNLSSKNPGGSPAKVDVTTTGGVRVSLDAVSSATAPSTDTSATVWAPTYSMSGAQIVSETGVATLMTGSGTRNVDIHLTGTKSGIDTFTGGAYGATVTVRCE